MYTLAPGLFMSTDLVVGYEHLIREGKHPTVVVMQLEEEGWTELSTLGPFKTRRVHLLIAVTGSPALWLEDTYTESECSCRKRQRWIL